MITTPDTAIAYVAPALPAPETPHPSENQQCDEAGSMLSELEAAVERGQDVRETSLPVLLGVARPELVRMRKASLTEGRDWYYTKPPRTVMITPAGLEVLRKLLALADPIAGGEVIPAPLARSEGWLSEDKIPKCQANGLILAKGRPGWWTAEEAVVRQNAFTNRRAIFVEWRGKSTICRVKDASAFVVGQVIPVRPYGNIVVAARQPRWPGKW